MCTNETKKPFCDISSSEKNDLISCIVSARRCGEAAGREKSLKKGISIGKTRKFTQEVEEDKFIKLKVYCLKKNKKLKEVLGEAIDKIIENIDLEKL